MLRVIPYSSYTVHLSPETTYIKVINPLQYHETADLDRLVEVLLTILDKPEKLLLLKDIRLVQLVQCMSY